VAYDLRLTNTNSRSYAINKTDISKYPAQAVIGKNESDINNKNNSLFIGNNVSSKYKIDSSGSEWTVEMDYNYYNNDNSQVYTNYNFLPAKPAVFGDGKNKRASGVG